MPNVLQIPVQNGITSLVWNGRPAPGVNSLLLFNQDLNNTVFLGNDPGINAVAANTVPLAPNGSLSVDPNSAWYVVGAAAGIKPLVMVPNGLQIFQGLTQGLGQLAIPSVKSPNFVSGSTGWQISKDGSAEFNNITIRGGTVLGGTELTYSSLPPTLGNLVASLSGTSFFDSAGNLVLAGNVGYTFIPSEPAYYAVVSSSNGVAIFRATTMAGPWSQMGGTAYVAGGFSGIQMYDQASGASLTMGDAIDGSGNIFAALAGVLSLYPAIGTPTPTPAGNGLVYANANGTPSANTPNGYAGALDVVQTDGTAHAAAAATAITPQQIGKAYSIPISDAKQFTTYRYTIWGIWAHGATAEAFTPQLSIAGVNGFGDIGVGSVAFPANHAGTFRIVWDFQLVTAPGSGAKWNLVGGGTLQDSGVNAGNTQASYALSSVTTGNVATGGAITQSTLAAISVGATCSWGGNGGGTITGYGTSFERIGP